MFVVTDFIDGGDLHKLWQETGSFDEDLVKIYVAEVALVLGQFDQQNLEEYSINRFFSIYRFPAQRWNYLSRLENGKHSDRFQWTLE